MLREFRTIQGRGLSTFDGTTGTAREFYFDDEHWTLRYLVADTGSWLKKHSVLVEANRLGKPDGRRAVISVRLSREELNRDASLDARKPVSQQYEMQRSRRNAWSPYRSIASAAGWGVVAPPGPATDLSGSERDPHLRSSAEIQSGYSILAEDGRVGLVRDFIINDDDWRIPYLVVRRNTFPFGKNVLLPTHRVEGISFRRAGIFVNLARFAIKEAPVYRASKPITSRVEQRLQKHYG
jgi:hypothetical protein